MIMKQNEVEGNHSLGKETTWERGCVPRAAVLQSIEYQLTRSDNICVMSDRLL